MPFATWKSVTRACAASTRFFRIFSCSSNQAALRRAGSSVSSRVVVMNAWAKALAILAESSGPRAS
jgi:hypothetical protein